VFCFGGGTSVIDATGAAGGAGGAGGAMLVDETNGAVWMTLGGPASTAVVCATLTGEAFGRKDAGGPATVAGIVRACMILKIC
jgi:hypothetical protein